MAGVSTAPAAMTALLAAIGEAFQPDPDLAGVVVRDGPEVTASSATEVVVVGWYGQAGDLVAVDGTLTMEGLADSPDREQYVIRCAALVLNGSKDITAARVRAYELAAAAFAAVAADRTLGGTVLRAGPATQSLLQEQIPNGARATVEFGVGCDAYTS
jgi:hypothetical protein